MGAFILNDGSNLEQPHWATRKGVIVYGLLSSPVISWESLDITCFGDDNMR